MTHRTLLLFLVILTALASAGCLDWFRETLSSTRPSSASIDLFSGSWSSVSSTTTVTDSCTAFQWTAAEVSGSTASGSFSATCYGDLQIAGTASATLAGNTVNWTANGVGATDATPECAVALTGTAKMEGEQIRIPYTGTTCLGAVSGTEILRKP